MLCILAVFIPAFFMQGAARSLFVPLALAVGFSMVASYLLSSTLVPVLSVWVLRTKHGQTTRRGTRPSTASADGYGRLSERRRAACAGWWCRLTCSPRGW